MALRRRPGRGLLAGLWEYPNELAGAGLDEFGVSPAETWAAGTGKHIFSHIEWHMTGLGARLDSPALPEGWVWANREELSQTYALPSAFRAFQAHVEERL